jgi:hypothetical protein
MHSSTLLLDVAPHESRHIGLAVVECWSHIYIRELSSYLVLCRDKRVEPCVLIDSNTKIPNESLRDFSVYKYWRRGPSECLDLVSLRLRL